jgi:hypothetical protein
MVISLVCGKGPLLEVSLKNGRVQSSVAAFYKTNLSSLRGFATRQTFGGFEGKDPREQVFAPS